MKHKLGSKYKVQEEEEVEKPKLQELFYDPSYKEKEQKQKELRVNLRYCPTGEIGNQFQKGLFSKCQFLVKIDHLKNSGQKLISIHKIYEWVTDNVDILFGDPVLRKLFSREVKIQRNSNDYKLKESFIKNIMALVEQLVIKNRNHMFKRQVEKLKSKYNLKNKDDFMLKT